MQKKNNACYLTILVDLPHQKFLVLSIFMLRFAKQSKDTVIRCEQKRYVSINI